MKKPYLPILLLAGIGLLSSCGGPDPYGDNVTLYAQIVNRAGAPAGSYELWTIGDPIGVFELTTGGKLPESLVKGEKENVNYQVVDVQYGVLQAVKKGTGFEYPKKGNVDFIAYYPWRATPKTGELYSITVKLGEQTSLAVQEACDLRYSNNAKNHGKKPNNPVKLEFKHSLAMVKLNIAFGEGLTGLTDDHISGVMLCNLPDSATLNLVDGTVKSGIVTTGVTEFAPLKIAHDPNRVATYTAIIAPQKASADSKITLTANGYDYVIPIAEDILSNSLYTYNVILTRAGVEVELRISDWLSGGNNLTGTANQQI